MLTLMRPGSVVSFKPYVQVFLQLIYVEIDLLPESDNIEFLEYGLMEPLADAVCLRISLPHAQAYLKQSHSQKISFVGSHDDSCINIR